MSDSAFVEAVMDALCRRRCAIVTRLGTFSPRFFKPYEGRNPRTGAVVPVPEKWLAVWETAAALLADVGAAPIDHEGEEIDEPPTKEPATTFEVAPALYDRVLEDLRTQRRAEVDGLGAWVIRSSPPVLQFRADPSVMPAMNR